MEMLTVVGGFIYDLAMLIIAVMSVVNFFTIRVLEKNTNSIKDALVQVTGESERAKGVIEGREQSSQLKSHHDSMPPSVAP